MSHDDREQRAHAAHALFVASGHVAPLSEAEEDVAAWMDLDLASLAENRLGDTADPRAIDAERRANWVCRATSDGKVHRPDNRFSTPYWLLADGQRAGTFSVATGALGSTSLHVSSLYVHPAFRGRGLARGALFGIYAAVRAAGLSGIRLETDWCWGRAVDLYRALGMWVHSWKRDIVFMLRSDLSRYAVVVDGDRARFEIVDEASGARTIAIEARREGAHLAWHEHAAMTSADDASAEIRFNAPGTFALALARAGFPLITSDEAWREQLELGFSDMGGPEGLAFKLRHWEAWAHRHCWQVDAPRIPGLDYPTWDDFERQWEERDRERSLRLQSSANRDRT